MNIIHKILAGYTVLVFRGHRLWWGTSKLVADTKLRGRHYKLCVALLNGFQHILQHINTTSFWKYSLFACERFLNKTRDTRGHVRCLGGGFGETNTVLLNLICTYTSVWSTVYWCWMGGFVDALLDMAVYLRFHVHRPYFCCYMPIRY